MLKILLLLIPISVFAQYTTKDIDSLMDYEVKRLRDLAKFQDIVKLSKNVIQQSERINYQKGLIYGYARLGNAECNLKNFKNAIEALNISLRLLETSEIEDNVIRTSIYTGIGRCYSESGASYKQAAHQFEKAEPFAKKIKDQYDRDVYLHIIYNNLSAIYLHLNDVKKSVEYVRKTPALEKDSYALASLARYHNFYTGIRDSARYYAELAAKSVSNDYDNSLLQNQWGKYYQDGKDYDRAIQYYSKGKRMAQKVREPRFLLESLDGLEICYEKKGDVKKALLYSKEKSRIQDGLKSRNVNHSDSAIDNLLNNKDNEAKKRLSDLQKYGIIIFIMLFGFVGLKIYSSRRNHKKSQNIIIEKENENQKLKEQLNEAFENIVLLAKDNNPEFIIRFSEIYPDYYNKLITIEPKLLNTEIKLCAMIFLGFSSKDIADYTFVTLKAAQHRKFRLRKKLNIPSDADINTWLNVNY